MEKEVSELLWGVMMVLRVVVGVGGGGVKDE